MEQRFSFKKLMSIVVVIAMLCSTFMFVVPASAESTNILAGKSYELSGCGVRTTYYAKLTDGLAAADLNGSDRNVDWFGFYCNGTDASIINAPDKIGYAIVDLGQEYNIDKVRTNVICKTSWGIHAPAAVNVYFSADGEEWGEANAFTVELVEGEGKWLELTGEWTANFIKFEYVLAGTFAFTNEIEAYGVAATADDDTSDDESSDVVEDSSDVVEDSSDVVDDSSDVVDDSSDVVDDSSDVVDDSSDVVDDSSDVVDDSSDVIDDSSDVVDDSSDVVDDSSDVVDESSDEVSEEISEDEPVTLQNIALNKNYTTHDPLGGYNANLTDGVKHDAMAYSGDHWFAFKSNPADGSGNLGGARTGSVVIDLAGSFDISGVMINAIYNDGAGVSLCSDAKVYLSEDGETWGEAISLTVPDGSGFANNTIYVIEGEVIGTANFVKVELTLGAKTFLFFNEIEVYGAVAEDDDTSDGESSDGESSDDVSSDESSDDVSSDESSDDVSSDESSDGESSDDVSSDESSDDVSSDESSDDVSSDESSDDVSSDESSDDVSSDESSDDVSSDESSDDESSDDTSSDDESSDDPVDPDPTIAYGDVYEDGVVDVFDYLLVKRAAFGTYDLSEDEYARANVFVDDVIDSVDYLLVKRIAFGTYDPYAEVDPVEPEPAPAPTPAPAE